MIPSLGKGRDAPVAEERESRSTRSERILIADEAEPVRRALLDILQKLGIPESGIHVADTAEQAIEIFDSAKPRLVLMELLGVHPDEGLDLIHAMLGTAPETRIVLVTAEPPDSAEVRAAVRAGIFAVVQKPVRHEKIRQVISDLETEAGGIERLR